VLDYGTGMNTRVATPMALEAVPEPIRPHLILIDADASVQDGVRMLGEVDGFTVTCFACAEDVLSAALPVDATHVLCAAELSGIDGIELYRHLRARGVDLPFALLISRDDRTLRRSAHRQRIAAVIEKPHVDVALLQFLQPIGAPH
jgi:FixJ family two-component response regulator